MEPLRRPLPHNLSRVMPLLPGEIKLLNEIFGVFQVFESVSKMPRFRREKKNPFSLFSHFNFFGRAMKMPERLESCKNEENWPRRGASCFGRADQQHREIISVVCRILAKALPHLNLALRLTPPYNFVL